MLFGWLPFLLKRGSILLSKVVIHCIVFLFCLSVVYKVSTVNMYYCFFFLPFDPLYPFLPPTTPASGNHQYVLRVYELVFSFVFLDSTYKRDHTALVFSVQLISFSIIPLRSIHVVKKWQNFLVYGWIIFHCMYICLHIYFMHLSLNGHLSCFHILVIINNTTVSTEVHVLGRGGGRVVLLFSSDKYLEVNSLKIW